MRVLHAGHTYELAHRDGDNTTKIQFVNKEPGTEQEGVITQEVLRMLIDRTRYCNNCLPHPNNERIIYHLRMALVLHEARALERKVEKEEVSPEYVKTGEDGHFALEQLSSFNKFFNKEETKHLDEYVPDWKRQCNYPIKPTK